MKSKTQENLLFTLILLLCLAALVMIADKSGVWTEVRSIDSATWCGVAWWSIGTFGIVGMLLMAGKTNSEEK